MRGGGTTSRCPLQQRNERLPRAARAPLEPLVQRAKLIPAVTIALIRAGSRGRATR